MANEKVFSYRRDILSSKIGLTLQSKLVLGSLLNIYYISNEDTIEVTSEYLERIYGVSKHKIAGAIQTLFNKGLVEIKGQRIGENGKTYYKFKMMPRINELFPDAVRHSELVPHPEKYTVSHNNPLNDEETEDYIRAARGTYRLHSLFEAT